MNFRVPFLRTFAVLAVAAHLPATSRAQEAAPGELKVMRLMIEQQAKQIEVLSAKLASLTAKFEDPARAVPTVPAAQVTKAEPPQPPAAKVVAPPPPPGPMHVVSKGESLGKIAQIHGTTIIEIQKLNHIRDPRRIQVGQQLKLPPTPAPAPAPAQPVPAATEPPQQPPKKEAN